MNADKINSFHSEMCPLSLRFDSKELEQQYKSWNYDESISMVRVIGVFTAFLHLFLIPVDIYILGDDADMLCWLRLLLLSPGAALIVYCSYKPWFKKIHQQLISLAVLLNGLVFGSCIMIYSNVVGSYFVAGVVTVVMFDFALLGVRFRSALLNSWAIIIYSTFMVLNYRQGTQLIASELYALLISGAILTISAYKLERTSRVAFSHLIQNLNNEQAKFNAEASRIKWLQNIAQFLRHEMRNALTGVNTSLELLTREMNAKEEMKYVNRAKKGMKTIGSLLESVSSATSIESAFYAEDTKEIDLCHLIEDHVVGYRMIYPEVEFELRLPNNNVKIRGNEERLYQMLDNLVSNAIDHHLEGTPVVLCLDMLERDCKLTVINEGTPLPEDRNAMFNLFASFREKPRIDEKRGIGLYVVKLIAEGYGGAVEVQEAGSGKPGAQFSVVLPTAA